VRVRPESIVFSDRLRERTHPAVTINYLRTSSSTMCRTHAIDALANRRCEGKLPWDMGRIDLLGHGP